jgi:tripartite-type tricarboxylate transporter receptor subunit TctC
VHVPGPALYQLEHGIEEAGHDITKLNWLGNFNIASNILVVGEKSPFRSLEDLQKAEVVKWAGSGPGTASYNMSLIVADKMKLNISHVTGYKGAVDYATGVARGDADIASSPPTTLLPFIESGQLIPLAVFGFDRLEIMPEVKTAQEQGFDITIEEVWPIAGPPGLPDDVLSYWEGIIAVALQDPDFIQLAKDAGRPLAPLSAKDATERVDRVFSDTVKILELTKK